MFIWDCSLRSGFYKFQGLIILVEYQILCKAINDSVFDPDNNNSELFTKCT